jgi:hypothetical protein
MTLCLVQLEDLAEANSNDYLWYNSDSMRNMIAQAIHIPEVYLRATNYIELYFPEGGRCNVTRQCSKKLRLLEGRWI